MPLNYEMRGGVANKVTTRTKLSIRRRHDIAHPYPVTISTGTGYAIYYYYLYPDVRTDLHCIGFEIKAIQNASFSWNAAFNASVAKGNTYFNATSGGGIVPAATAITAGGFINRFKYKNSKGTKGLEALLTAAISSKTSNRILLIIVVFLALALSCDYKITTLGQNKLNRQ